MKTLTSIKTFTKMRRPANGQAAVILTLAITALVGAMSLCIDIAVLYWNYNQLQSAADSAVLAGANYLPDNPSQAKTTAVQIAKKNGIADSEIIATSISGDDLSISVTLTRTVSYYFARVLGLTTGKVATTSTATAQLPATTVGASTPAQVQGGDNNGNNGTYCSSTGGCDLIPIGLDTNTPYTDGNRIVLQQGEIGPGNFDLLALGGVGGNNLRTNIANGYSGPVSIGDWVTTEPGKKVGPVDQGFQDRMTLAQSVDPSGTYSSHPLTDPRVMILPVVDWEHQNGRKTVEVTAFASVWLDSYSGGKVTVNFISQVADKSFGSASAPNFGARGQPFLNK